MRLLCYVVFFWVPVVTFAQPSLLIPIGHGGWTTNAQFSPDSKIILTVGQGTAKIWDTSTGKLLRNVDGLGLSSACFNKTGEFILLANGSQIALARARDGKTEYQFSDGNPYAFFSDDGKYIFSCDTTLIVHTADRNGSTIKTLDINASIYEVKLTTDKKYLIIATSKGTRLYENETFVRRDPSNVESLNGRPLWSRQNSGTVISPDGKSAVKFGYQLELIDRATRRVTSLSGYSSPTTRLTVNEDETDLITVSKDGKIRIWDIAGGKLRHVLDQPNVSGVRVTPDGKYLVSFSERSKICMWDAKTGALLATVGHEVQQRGVDKSAFYGSFFFELSPDGKYLVTNMDSFPFGLDFKVLNVPSGKQQSSFHIPDRDFVVTEIQSNLTGDKVMLRETSRPSFDSINHSITKYRVADLASGKLDSVYYATNSGGFACFAGDHLLTSDGYSATVGTELQLGSKLSKSKLILSYSKKYVAAAANTDLELFDVTTLKRTTYIKSALLIDRIELSADSKNILVQTGKVTTVYSITGNKLVEIPAINLRWSTDSKLLLLPSTAENLEVVNLSGDRFTVSHSDEIVARRITSNYIFTYSINDGIKISTNGSTTRELTSLIPLVDSEWVVKHESGLFDASPLAAGYLHFVQGDDIIEFNQLKDRYYEPGLWTKTIRGESLRKVTGFRSIDLPPDIEVGSVDAKGYLPISLINRGGGIGEVNIFINSKEIIADARPKGTDVNTPKLMLNVNVGSYSRLIKGGENFVAVKGWNAKHWVVSRSQVVSYHAAETEPVKPVVYILSCGISDYTGTELDLKYASKDAVDVSTALQIGAKQLFGTDRTVTYALTTGGPPTALPTKENILKTLDKIAAVAKPADVVILYLSGHGITLSDEAGGDWYYLTQDAYTTSLGAYNDPGIRSRTTIASSELVESFKKVAALKQLMVIDACASGKIVDNFIAKKDVPSDAIRALDRMRDRVGIHIITGCAADAVSYEASQYGQGVLTYSILEGMRGAALRDDKFVDVVKLLQYARDRVPTLAQGIGGIQTPQVLSPVGSASFDIGILTDVEKKSIPVARIHPVYIRSNFQDENELEDVLGLGKLIDDALNDASSKGIESQIIFVDVKDYPDACKLIGRYKVSNGKIEMQLRKKCGETSTTFSIVGKDAAELKEEILKRL